MTAALARMDPGVNRRRDPIFGWAAVAVAGIAGLLAVPAIVLYLLWSGIDIFFGERAWTLLVNEWRPGEGVFGIIPLVVGTLTTSFFALLLAVPLGLGTVIYLLYFSGARLQRFGESALGILGGTPSVVFGLFGTVWLIPRLGPSLA